VIFFLKGAVIGFLIAVPAGPAGIMCIRYTLSWGMMVGFVFGLGVVLADMIYCAIAIFGVAVIVDFLQDYRHYLAIASSVSLLFLGWYIFRSQVGELAPMPSITSMFGSFAAAFFLAMANPLTILAFAAVFTGIGVGADADYRELLPLIGGVCSGSAIAWLALSRIAGSLRAHFRHRQLQILNQFSGVIIAGLGVFSLIDIFK
jgi:threonine/homoserine/homoserine lactone efflux protein